MKETFNLPKGKYYIGDPSYAFSTDTWSEFTHESDYGSNGLFRKSKVAAGGTAHGDGEYTDQDAYSYPVDTGMLGILPIKLLKIDNKLTAEKIEKGHYGRVVNFKEDFIVEIEDGVFNFGGIKIDTDGSEEDDEDALRERAEEDGYSRYR